MASYIFDQAWEREFERHAAVERTWDPFTIERIHSLGFRKGWCCLEVGAGGGSIAAWLAENAVGGFVLAADLDPRHLWRLSYPNLKVLKLDISREDVPKKEFDFGHARLLLENLEDPVSAIARMASSLKPGGLLLLEDYDFSSRAIFPESGDFAAVNIAHVLDLRASGGDPECGRKLASYARDAGLGEITAQARSLVYFGGSRDAVGRRLSLEQRRARLVNTGLVSERELEGCLRCLEDPAFTFLSPTLVSVSGRR